MIRNIQALSLHSNFILCFFFSLLFGVFVITTPGCSGGSSSGNSQFQYLPDIDIECYLAQTSDCSSSNQGKSFFIGLTSNTNVNCESYLSQSLSQTMLRQSFDFSGTGTTYYSTFLSGTVTSWVNSNNVTVLTMQSTTYKACAFIDIDGNGLFGNTEPVGELSLSPSNNNPQITDWY